jgi:hypothetical protein
MIRLLVAVRAGLKWPGNSAGINLSLGRCRAQALLKNERTAKVGVKNKRLAVALGEDYLTKGLLGA